MSEYNPKIWPTKFQMFKLKLIQFKLLTNSYSITF